MKTIKSNWIKNTPTHHGSRIYYINGELLIVNEYHFNDSDNGVIPKFSKPVNIPVTIGK